MNPKQTFLICALSQLHDRLENHAANSENQQGTIHNTKALAKIPKMHAILGKKQAHTSHQILGYHYLLQGLPKLEDFPLRGYLAWEPEQEIFFVFLGIQNTKLYPAMP